MTLRVAINGCFAALPDTGSGQYTLRLSEQLTALGVDVSLLVPGPFVGRVPKLAGVRTASVGSRLPGHAGKVWFEQVGVVREAVRLGAELLHIPYLGPPLRSPLPTVVTVHDLLQIAVPELRGGPLVRFYNRLAAAGARRASALLADSDHTRADVLRELRVPASRVRTVHLAAGELFGPEGDPAEREGIARRYGLEDAYLLYIGGLDWRKNVPLLIRAYARSGCSHPLAIAGAPRSGSTARFPDLRSVAAEAGVAERVRFLGFVAEEDKPALYRGALLFAFPSRYEGFGLPPLEAMACGTPVICSRAASLPEVAGEGALLFDPDDEPALASAIGRLAADPGLRGVMRERGLRQAARFSWRATASETIRVYEDVLQREPARVG